MPSDERMSVDERRKYLKMVAPRYARADDKEPSGLHVSLDCCMATNNLSGLRSGVEIRCGMVRYHGGSLPEMDAV